MTTSQLPRHPKALRVRSYSSAAPPRIVEYAYYALIFYGMTAQSLGLLVPLLAGGMLLVLAAVCVIRLRSRAPAVWATAVYAPMRLPLACGISFLVVQITVHGESIMEGLARGFITWILTLIIIQSLCLRRGLLHRYAIVLFVIGLTTLPYLAFEGPGVEGVPERARVGSMISGDFTNSNGLGGWFGYCCLYFTILGIETKRTGVRVASGLTAVGCLYIVGLTVSRGALLGIASGIIIAFRGLLKRGFVPLLVFIILSGILFNLGIFDRIISHYATRGTEESGRFLVWPLAIERFLSSPLLGVGASNVATRVPGVDIPMSPHNTFIFFGLSSGVLPLAFFVAWWIRVAQNAFSYSERLADGPFRLPFLVYTFWIILFGSLGFMAPWGVVTLCVTMAPNTPYGVRRLVVRRVERRRTAQALDTPTEARPHIAHRRL